MTVLRWGVASDVGRIRTNNEDSALVAEPLFAVADGMGGHAAGEVASRLALDTLNDAMSNGSRSLDTLIEAIKQANVAVYEKAQSDPALRGMGTTLCAVALVTIEGHERLAVANVGDSRVYVVQDGVLLQVTEDHTLVEAMVRQGTISAEEASVHPQRNILTRALGIDPDVGVDSWEVAPFAGDRYLLCSDGLFNEVPDGQMAHILTNTADPQEAASVLVRLANEGGGRDNITVVIVDVVEGLDPASAAPVEDELPAPAPDDNNVTRSFMPPVGDWLADAAPPPAADDLPPPAPLPPPSADTKGKGAVSGPRRRLVTLRSSAFVLSVLAVVGVAAVAVGWYARASYYVAFDGNTVTLFKGRPGGFLWFQPTVEKRYALERAGVPPGKVSVLEKGKTRPSVSAADDYVKNLEDEAASLGTAGPTTVPSATGTSTPTTAGTPSPTQP